MFPHKSWEEPFLQKRKQRSQEHIHWKSGLPCPKALPGRGRAALQLRTLHLPPWAPGPSPLTALHSHQGETRILQRMDLCSAPGPTLSDICTPHPGRCGHNRAPCKPHSHRPAARSREGRNGSSAPDCCCVPLYGTRVLPSCSSCGKQCTEAPGPACVCQLAMVTWMRLDYDEGTADTRRPGGRPVFPCSGPPLLSLSLPT